MRTKESSRVERAIKFRFEGGPDVTLEFMTMEAQGVTYDVMLTGLLLFYPPMLFKDFSIHTC